MSYITTTLGNLLHQTAFLGLSWGNYLMIAVACLFLYLAIAKDFNAFSYAHVHNSSFDSSLSMKFYYFRSSADFHIS